LSAKNLLLIGVGLTGAVTFLPFFSTTKEGFRAGLRYEPSTAASLFSEVLVGGMGLLGGYSIVKAYISKRSRLASVASDPVLMSLRLPYAVLGSVIGASLCFALSSHMVRFGLKVGKTIGYTVDGVVYDLGGGWSSGDVAPWQNQNETKWNGNDSLGWNRIWDQLGGKDKQIGDKVEESRRALEKTRTEMKMNETERAAGVADGTMANTEDGTTTLMRSQDNHLDSLISGLVALRQEEQVLHGKLEYLDPQSSLAASMQLKLLNIRDDKTALKQEGIELGCPRISQLLNGKVNTRVQELSELRNQQQALALTFADRQTDPDERKAAMVLLRQIDHQKHQLKSRAWKKYGAKISGLAVKRKNWKSTIKEATELDLTA
jgi:hypothetical protein